MDEKLRRRDAEIEEISDEKRLLVKQMKEAMNTSENLEIKIRDMIDKYVHNFLLIKYHR